jgi:hypothetical protein
LRSSTVDEQRARPGLPVIFRTNPVEPAFEADVAGAAADHPDQITGMQPDQDGEMAAPRHRIDPFGRHLPPDQYRIILRRRYGRPEDT